MKYIVLTISIFLFSCSVQPVIPFYDRHTVMEAESAGEWPDYEKDILSRSVQHGAVFVPKDLSQEKRKRALNALHGEMLSSQ